ncbi:M13 family metallopeptidase [Alteromonas lipolytica]|uniref:Peptidase n=1 Tax=Alteromonas lipolytica TaxID=1856405 RepID=A0A1E8FDA2_9ALTE|nr:M13 family metallopeptidase [Alteromonas lipolytica]OFI33463.1 peptidase [Alteromonas lipolytica]GGF59460.1 peptidase M13 [Alteromonas lipolytica]
MNRLSMLSPLLLALALTGCSKPEEATTPAATETTSDSTASGAAEVGTWGIDLDQMNTAIRPGQDFNKYVNGHWMETFEIPSDQSRYGVFMALRERSTEQVKDIIESLREESGAPGSLVQKVGSYYGTWMNVEALNDKGTTPIEPWLAEIAAIKSSDDLVNFVASLHHASPIGFGTFPDPADTTRYTAGIWQSGLGMPDRDYYLKDEEKFVKYQQAYKDYMVKVMTLAGISDAEAKAQSIYQIEYELAKVHWSREESRDIKKIYNPMTPAELKTLAPEFDWQAMFAKLGLSEIESFVVMQPDAIQASATLLQEIPVERWKEYLTFHFIDANAALLTAETDQAQFDFYSTTLRGVPDQRARWKRGSDLVNRNLGEAVGKIYVDRHFPPAAKKQMDDLVKNLRIAFEARIKDNTWMDDETKQQALLKLSTFEPHIGYTNKWINYDKLNIVEGDMVGNAARITEFMWQQDVDKLGGPVDREQWPYPPQTVNASYNPLMNQITFPAGILQPPFFDMNADPAVNYGAIGAVIGHEIGHGFDDQGRRFDELGKIRDWWTGTADENFKLRSDKLVAQYDTFSPIEGQNVNGRLTLGENIGDLGGLEMAYSAYQLHKEKHGEPPVLDGFTGDQRFFMAWAQVWRMKIRDDALRQQLLSDPHSPAQYRVNGVVRNMDAWYSAFNVTEDDLMYLPPEERVSIW